jgi:hypothetical protein
VFVLTVVRNVKFHLDQNEIALSTAKSALLREDPQEQKTTTAENTAEKTAREDHHLYQKMLVSKF